MCGIASWGRNQPAGGTVVVLVLLLPGALCVNPTVSVETPPVWLEEWCVGNDRRDNTPVVPYDTVQ